MILSTEPIASYLSDLSTTVFTRQAAVGDSMPMRRNMQVLEGEFDSSIHSY